jgi:hypothetical protein
MALKAPPAPPDFREARNLLAHLATEELDSDELAHSGLIENR